MENAIVLANCPSYSDSNVARAMDNIFKTLPGFDLRSYFGKKVVVKPNLLSPHDPDKAVTTHPAIVREVAKRLVDSGAKVIIADSPAGLYNKSVMEKLYKSCGIDVATEGTGAILNRDYTYQTVKCDAGAIIEDFHCLTPIVEADAIINISKLKTHGLTYFTGAVKNMFGMVPGLDKAAFHSRFPDRHSFNRLLVDLCVSRLPTVSIMDGVVGMEGPGPSGGKPKRVGVIGASTNPFALDMAMADLVALPLSQIPIITEAIKRGYLPERPERLLWFGDDRKAFDTTFEPADKGNREGSLLWFILDRFVLPKKYRDYFAEKRSPWPIISNRCIRCGRCAEICPRQIITSDETGFWPTYAKCIRCYCCHEVCPVKAIDLKKGSLKKIEKYESRGK